MRHKVSLSILGGVIVCLCGIFLTYWSWCWGWWGRENPFMHYLFQCNCPASSEEARYPSYVDIVMPACEIPHFQSVRMSPTGRYMYIRTEKNGTFLYDWQENKRESVPFSTAEVIGLLDDKTVWMRNRLTDIHGNTLTDLFDVYGNKIPADLNYLINLKYQNFVSQTVAVAQSADKVYIGKRGDLSLLLALAPDSLPHPIQIGKYENFPEILTQAGISFESVEVTSKVTLSNLRGETEGIFSTATGQQLVPGYADQALFWSKGWVYDGRGIVLEPFLETYLFDSGPDILRMQIMRLFLPVLLLKPPREYLSPERQAAEDARQTLEAANRFGAAIVFWVVAAVGLGGVAMIFRRRITHAYQKATQPKPSAAPRP